MENRNYDNYINICNLEKVYKQSNHEELVVFKNLNMAFELGKVSCIMGESGCGKSTLINIISGFEHTTSGTVFFRNHEELKTTDVGVIFQDNALFPWKTVLQNLRFVLRMQGIRSKESTEIALEYLNRINMNGVKDCYPHELSGGMQQKIVLLRVILYNPKLIIMDEAFCALDSLTRWKMQDFFLDIHKKQKYTAIVVTHDIDEAIRLSDSIYILSKNSKQCSKVIKNELPRPIERNHDFYLLQQHITECLYKSEKI